MNQNEIEQYRWQTFIKYGDIFAQKIQTHATDAYQNYLAPTLTAGREYDGKDLEWDVELVRTDKGDIHVETLRLKQPKEEKAFPETVKEVEQYEADNIGNPDVNFPIDEMLSDFQKRLNSSQQQKGHSDLGASLSSKSTEDEFNRILSGSQSSKLLSQWAEARVHDIPGQQKNSGTVEDLQIAKFEALLRKYGIFEYDVRIFSVLEEMHYNWQQSQSIEPIKHVSDVWIVVTANAELLNGIIYTDKSKADAICAKNTFGSYFTVLLRDHISSLYSWYEKGTDDFLRE